MESTSTYSFIDLFSDVSEYIGWGRSPGTTDLATSKRRTNDGYRNFLTAHDWNFLKRTKVLVTEAGKWHYDLPDDFSELIIPFKYPADDGWINLTEKDEDYIMSMKTGSGSSSGRPSVFSIRNKEYSVDEGTRWEVIFPYEVDSVYELYYTYRMVVNELSGDDDIHVGGARYSNLLRTYCLSEVEKFDIEMPATWTSQIPSLLARAISMDKRNSGRNLGVMRGTSETEEVGFNRRQKQLYYNGEAIS